MGRYSREREDFKTARQKTEATRKKLDSVKTFEEIENTVLLSREVMSTLKEIASEVGHDRRTNLTYSETVAYLVKYYRQSQRR